MEGLADASGYRGSMSSEGEMLMDDTMVLLCFTCTTFWINTYYLREAKREK